MTLSALLVPGMGLQGRIAIVLGIVIIPSMWEFLPTPLGNQYYYLDDPDDDLGL